MRSLKSRGAKNAIVIEKRKKYRKNLQKTFKTNGKKGSKIQDFQKRGEKNMSKSPKFLMTFIKIIFDFW